MIFFLGFILLWLPVRILYPTKVIGKKNLPKGKGAVLTCNHYTNMDAVLLDIYLNKKIRYLSKIELFKNKFVGFIIRGVGGFPINREKPEMSSIKFALATLKDNKYLGIFPEGTRNKEGDESQLLELKNGAIMFASKGESVIVPMILYKRPRIFRKNYLLIGEPISVEGENPKKLSQEEVYKNTQRLFDALEKLRRDMDEKLKLKKN